MGLDRKDNSGGYTPENTVPCCKDCNSLKSNTLSYDEAMLLVKTLKKYRGDKKCHPGKRLKKA
jgi:hypothetical protein